MKNKKETLMCSYTDLYLQSETHGYFYIIIYNILLSNKKGTRAF